MSSSELLDEEYDYYRYSNRFYEENRSVPRAPLISKKARLLAASVANDVETLKQLLDDPKWYKVRDKEGLNLLQIAILGGSDEVFNYLLSLKDFPLEAIDNHGATALIVAVSYPFFYPHSWREYDQSDLYAVELIKKGADIDKISREGDPLLHCALRHRFLRTARLLLERGADVNMLSKKGNTPIHECTSRYSGIDIESVIMLLCYGADPSICDGYGRSILNKALTFGGVTSYKEMLFKFIVDEWSSFKISGFALLKLAQYESPLFHQVVKFTPEIIFEDNLFFHCLCLFEIDSECLGILLEKYPYFIEELLQSYSAHRSFHEQNYIFRRFNLKNFDMLIQSSLCSDAIMEFIRKLNSNRLISDILSTKKNVDEVMEKIYYLLSYGMSLNERDLEIIYERTGYSKDLKNLLFMDVQKKIGQQITKMMPRLIYDVTLDIHKIVENPSSCAFIDWDEIFHYFVHPKIQNAYHQLKPHEASKKQLPQLPLLKELARDSFRKYFIKVFEITTARQFYTLLKQLKINPVYKEIITYETKLY